VTVDHGQAGSHVAREVESREAGTEREGCERVAEIVDATQRHNARRDLGPFPVAVAELVKVDHRNATEREADSRSGPSVGLERPARPPAAAPPEMLASVLVLLSRPFLSGDGRGRLLLGGPCRAARAPPTRRAVVRPRRQT
jgi:hypothetical protein